MKRVISLAGMLVILAAHSAAAQEVADTTVTGVAEEVQVILERSGIGTAMDSIVAVSAPELEEALGELTRKLNVVAERIATDPQLRASALRAAEGIVELAQIVVAEQSDSLLEALRAAAEELSTLPRTEPKDRTVR